jgi:tRNA/tmRNA/rRNA uracil-C5-methylase (TrmA/RlmC/RlmD family)
MWRIDAATFWQVHPSAVATLGDALLAGLRPRPGDRVLDLYAGAGAFTALLAAAVGPDGAVIGVESSATAVADACRNLADVAHAEVRRGAVDAAFLQAAGVDPDLVDPDLVDPDLVVLDPPRAGAGAAVMRAILALGPRAVGYVSCDAGTLARDVAVAREQGWALASLRVFDAFPMTAHVECVAILQRRDGRGAPRVVIAPGTQGTHDP